MSWFRNDINICNHNPDGWRCACPKKKQLSIIAVAFVCCTRNGLDMTGPCWNSQITTVRYVGSRCIFEEFWKIIRRRAINLLIDTCVVMTEQRVNHICVPMTCTLASLLCLHYLLLNCLHSFWYFVGVHLH